MKKCILEETVLFGTILLLIVGADISACDGPCTQLDDDCGNLGGGMGTCEYDLYKRRCDGVCPGYCPSGDPDYYCEQVAGSCTITMVECSIMIKYRCETCMIGPPHCTCEESGTGGACPRQIC